MWDGLPRCSQLSVIWSLHIRNRILSAILLLAILSAIGAIIYLVVASKTSGGFTEFYLLGLNGKAENYPTSLRVGEEGKVIVGITNREHKTMTYRVEVSVNGTVVNTIEAVTLKPDEDKQHVTGFRLAKSGEKQKVEFLLYRPVDDVAYRKLHLFVDGR